MSTTSTTNNSKPLPVISDETAVQFRRNLSAIHHALAQYCSDNRLPFTLPEYDKCSKADLRSLCSFAVGALERKESDAELSRLVPIVRAIENIRDSHMVAARAQYDTSAKAVAELPEALRVQALSGFAQTVQIPIGALTSAWAFPADHDKKLAAQIMLKDLMGPILSKRFGYQIAKIGDENYVVFPFTPAPVA